MSENTGYDEDIRKQINTGIPGQKGGQVFYKPEDFFERYIFLERGQEGCRIREILGRDGNLLEAGRKELLCCS